MLYIDYIIIILKITLGYVTSKFHAAWRFNVFLFVFDFPNKLEHVLTKILVYQPQYKVMNMTMFY